MDSTEGADRVCCGTWGFAGDLGAWWVSIDGAVGGKHRMGGAYKCAGSNMIAAAVMLMLNRKGEEKVEKIDDDVNVR